MLIVGTAKPQDYIDIGYTYDSKGILQGFTIFHVPGDFRVIIPATKDSGSDNLIVFRNAALSYIFLKDAPFDAFVSKE